MADAIDREFKIRPKLIESGGGVFEVVVNGDLIFSKKELGRFPEHEEILGTLRGLPSG